MAIDTLKYKPVGDKKNSDFFEDYRMKILEWRKKSGLDEILTRMRGIVIQVQTGDAFNYLKELYLMSPYRFVHGYRNLTHKVYVLKNSEKTPLYFVTEPLRLDYTDENTRLNNLYTLASGMPNARYIGEIFHSDNLKESYKLIASHNIRFHSPEESFNALYANNHFLFTEPSSYTHNRFGYTSEDLQDVSRLDLGVSFDLSSEQLDELKQLDEKFESTGLKKLLLGIDHLATRILSSNREAAILECLTCTNYYLWGAYNIAAMNSSTNVTRHPSIKDDKHSPAKVFTANNVPYLVNAFEGKPMPTEDFVRNMGPRMHHMAQEVLDGDHNSGQKNVDYVIETIKKHGVNFLANIVGECKDEPDLKQIFSKRSAFSMLITEYVERCHGFEGFFTKKNVAALTEAAGKDEELKDHGHIFD